MRRFEHSEHHTFGILTLYDENQGKQGQLFTLELPLSGNRRNESCIMPGMYLVERHQSPSKGDCYRVRELDGQHVEGRTHILIHKGNYTRDTLGCILPGMGMADINKDGDWDVTSSAVAMANIRKWQPESFYLHIL